MSIVALGCSSDGPQLIIPPAALATAEPAPTAVAPVFEPTAQPAAQPVGIPPFVAPNERAVLDRIQLPSGWVISSDGRRAAQLAEDLDRGVPVGLRVTVDGADEPAALDETLVTEGFSVVEDPAAYTVFGEAPAVAMTVEIGIDGEMLTQRHIVASLGGAAYLITLDGPSGVDFAPIEDALGLVLS